MSDPDSSLPSSAAPPSGWGPSAALAVGRGGSARQSTSVTNTSGILRGKSFVGFLNDAALGQVCGVATANCNNNKRLDKQIDGICIKKDCKTPSHLNVKRSPNFLPGWYLTRKEQKELMTFTCFLEELCLWRLYTLRAF